MSDTSLPPIPVPPPASQRTGPPWEQSGPWLGRFVDTAKGVLTDPTRAFDDMRREGGLAPPLAFAVIGLIAGSLASVIFQAIGVGTSLGRPFGESSLGLLSLWATLIVVPVVATVSLFVFAGLFHVMLLLLNAAKHPFETTFRTYAYASGATALLGMIPICGGIIGAIWNVVATIIGIARTQEATTGTAAIAVLVPVTVCCGTALLLFGASLLAVAGLAALAGMN